MMDRSISSPRIVGSGARLNRLGPTQLCLVSVYGRTLRGMNTACTRDAIAYILIAVAAAPVVAVRYTVVGMAVCYY